ncbi:MAG: PAS domain S-box protein [Planctomycetes bacterium]|nr:PAS domain S-box protein [Planctomycetota bacterium]
MTSKRRNTGHTPTLRELARARLADKPLADLDALTRPEIRDLLHELEVHKVELQIQNEQLIESRLAAEASSERYRDLYDSAPIGFVALDAQGTIVESNLPFAVQLGIPRSRVIGRKLASFVAPRSQDRWHLERRALGLGSERRTFELEFTRRDGSAMHVQLVGARRELGHAGEDQVHLAVLDVTELRRAERALRAAVTQVSLVEQRERRKLAAELHDGAGQLISLALLKLRVLSGASPAQLAAMREIEEILTETSKCVSSLSFELSPPLLHDLGLRAAAQWLAEDLQRRYGLAVELRELEDVPLDDAASSALYRAMRELLINVAKHSGVRTARVSILPDRGMACVTVEDAGVGLGSEAEGRGFGLLALRERLAEVGGSLEMAQALGGGTRAVARVPIADATTSNRASDASSKRSTPVESAHPRSDRAGPR